MCYNNNSNNNNNNHNNNNNNISFLTCTAECLSFKLLDDLKVRRWYWKLKEEALDPAVWETGFGWGYVGVVKTYNRANRWFKRFIQRCCQLLRLPKADERWVNWHGALAEWYWRGKSAFFGEMHGHCNFVDHKSHVYCSGIDSWVVPWRYMNQFCRREKKICMWDFEEIGVWRKSWPASEASTEVVSVKAVW